MTWGGWPEFVESDFCFTQWRDPFDDCACDPRRLSRRLRDLHRDMTAAKDSGAEAMRFIVGGYIGFELVPENPDSPLVSVHERAPLQSEPALVKGLEAIMPHVAQAANPELRARIADLCWLIVPKSKSHGCRQVALDAYLEAATIQINNADRLSAVDRVQRAAQLLRQLVGKKWQSTPEFERIASNALVLFEVTPLQEPGVYVPAARLLCEMKPPLVTDFANLISKKVADCRESGEFRGATSLLEELVRWHQGQSDHVAVAATRVEIAETFIQEASSRRNPFVQRHFLEKAVVALREAGGQGARVDQLHRRIVDLGGAITEQASIISGEIPIPEALAVWVENQVKAVQSSNSLLEALHFFAMLVLAALPSKSEAEQRIQSSPLRIRDLISVLGLSSDGRATHRRPTRLEDPKAFTACELAGETRRYIHFFGLLVFAPLREAILEKFNPSLREIEEVLAYTPFLPIGRERIVARGLLMGFRGEDFEGAHLLLPQLENGLRTLLIAAGRIPSKLDKDLLQDSYLLNHLLENDASLVSLLGDNLVNALRSLLVHRCGSNFRNELLHGLSDQRDGTNMDGLCVWALMIALIMGSMQPPARHDGAADKPPPDSGGEVM